MYAIDLIAKDEKKENKGEEQNGKKRDLYFYCRCSNQPGVQRLPEMLAECMPL